MCDLWRCCSCLGAVNEGEMLFPSKISLNLQYVTMVMKNPYRSVWQERTPNSQQEMSCRTIITSWNISARYVEINLDSFIKQKLPTTKFPGVQNHPLLLCLRLDVRYLSTLWAWRAEVWQVMPKEYSLFLRPTRPTLADFCILRALPVLRN